MDAAHSARGAIVISKAAQWMQLARHVVPSRYRRLHIGCSTPGMWCHCADRRPYSGCGALSMWCRRDIIGIGHTWRLCFEQQAARWAQSLAPSLQSVSCAVAAVKLDAWSLKPISCAWQQSSSARRAFASINHLHVRQQITHGMWRFRFHQSAAHWWQSRSAHSAFASINQLHVGSPAAWAVDQLGTCALASGQSHAWRLCFTTH